MRTAPLVAVVNETMVAKYWRGENPVGKRLKVKDRWMQVVGVVKTSKYANLLETTSRSSMFLCARIPRASGIVCSNAAGP